MDSTASTWSDPEQAIARAAFEQALVRSGEVLIAAVQHQASLLTTLDSLWQLHDFLSIQRHVIEGRSEFQLDGILFVFASLVKEGLLQLEELDGLDADKLAKVSAMARF